MVNNAEDENDARNAWTMLVQSADVIKRINECAGQLEPLLEAHHSRLGTRIRSAGPDVL